MNQRDWISAIYRRKLVGQVAPAWVFAPHATAPAGLPKDKEEQEARIRNLAADTKLKEQALAYGRIQLVLAIVAVVAALGTVLVGAVTVYLDHRGTPKANDALIFVPEHPNFVV